MEVVVYNWSYKKCKAAVKMPPPTPISFTGRIPFLSPNQLPPSEYKWLLSFTKIALII